MENLVGNIVISMYGASGVLGDHFIKYMIASSLCCTPKTNTNKIKCKL